MILSKVIRYLSIQFSATIPQYLHVNARLELIQFLLFS